MSLGYAEKLSYREDLGGQLGAPELLDSTAEIEKGVERLAQLVGLGADRYNKQAAARLSQPAPVLPLQHTRHCPDFSSRYGAPSALWPSPAPASAPPAAFQTSGELLGWADGGSKLLAPAACQLRELVKPLRPAAASAMPCRGPKGIWTLQRAGQPLPRPKVSFTHATPSLTHQARAAELVLLW